MTHVGSSANDVGTPTSGGPARTLRPRRGLPSGRAVVGGFLVALAAVGVFAAYTSAAAGPQTSYAVAARDLAPGDRIDAGAVRLVPLHLPDEQRRRSYDAVEPLLQTTVVEPLLTGELLQEGSVVATGASSGTRTVSFAVEPARAVNATLKAGERIDVFATFGTGGEACTHLVAGDVAVVAVDQTSAALTGQGGLTVTVEVPTADTGAAVAHASTAGTMTLVRSTHAAPSDVPAVCTPNDPAREQ